jgi:tetratricopeptide (TPR) repeat protein
MRFGNRKREKARIKPASIDPQSLPAPETADDFICRGMLFYARRQYELAADDVRKAIALDPRHEDAYFSLGMVQKAMRNNQDAIEAFRQVILLLQTNSSDTHARKEMLRRLALGHINEITDGDWNLEKEIWVHVS